MPNIGEILQEDNTEILQETNENLLLEYGVTPIFACGFECGAFDAGSDALSNMANHWTFIGPGTGILSIDTATVRSGGLRSLKVVTAGTEISLEKQMDFAGEPSVIVGRFYVRFESWTTEVENVELIRIQTEPTGGQGTIELDLTTMKVGIQLQGTTKVDAPTALVLDQWYLIDFMFDWSATTWSCFLKVQPAGGTQETVTGPTRSGQTVRGTRYLRLGLATGTFSTVTAYFDDLLLSANAVDYPLGAGYTTGLIPNADGTHSFTLGDFKDSNTTNIAVAATDVHTLLAERPVNSANALFLSQNVVRPAGYVEVGFEDGSRDAMGIEIVAALRSQNLSGQPNSVSIKLKDGTVIRDIWTGVDLSRGTQMVVSAHLANAPNAESNWPQANLNALLMQLGFATDVTPVPHWEAVMLEAAFLPSPEAQNMDQTALTLALGLPATTLVPSAVTASQIALALSLGLPVNEATISQLLQQTALALTLGLPVTTVVPGASSAQQAALTLVLGLPTTTTQVGAVTALQTALALLLTLPANTVTAGAITATQTALALALSLRTTTVAMGAVTAAQSALALLLTLRTTTVTAGATSALQAALNLLLTLGTTNIGTAPQAAEQVALPITVGLPASTLTAGAAQAAQQALQLLVQLGATEVTAGPVTLVQTPLGLVLILATTTVTEGGAEVPVIFAQLVVTLDPSERTVALDPSRLVAALDASQLAVNLSPSVLH